MSDGHTPEWNKTRTAGVPGPSERASAEPPRFIAGFRTIREIGAGGMGTVFEAFDERMRRHVALKVLGRGAGASDKAALRFAHEAWIEGRLDHPNLIKVFDRGETEDVSWYTMELVDGGSLHDVVRNLRTVGRDERLRLSFEGRDYVGWAVRQVGIAARALHHAHLQGVVHRDVKPANLLLSLAHRTLKVADFGLALSPENVRLTTAGTLIGTIAYMAPEQILARRGEIGPATDVYALGVTLFELVTLELPYVGETQQIYQNAVLTSQARRARALNQRVGRDLEIVIRKALEKSPRDRYPTAQALAEDLDNVVHLRPIVAKPPSPARRMLQWGRRRPAHAALLATLAIATPTVALLGQRAWSQQRLLGQARVNDLWQQVRFLHQRGRWAEVMTTAAALLELDPTHARALRSSAIARMELAGSTMDPRERERLHEGALADLDRLIALNPAVSWPHALKAEALKRFGRIDQAAAEQAAAVLLRPAQPSPDELRFDAWSAIAGADFARAVDLLSEVVTAQPTSAEAFADRADAYDALGQAARAETDWRVALGLAPDNPYFNIGLGRLLGRDASRLEEAERVARRAVELAPKDYQTWELLADVLINRGKKAEAASRGDEAVSHLRDAESAARSELALAPTAPWGRANLGSALIERSRLAPGDAPRLLAEAIRKLEEALATWPSPPAGETRDAYVGTASNLCDALLETRQLPRALDVCTRVTLVQPDSAVAYYNLAGARTLSGDLDGGIAALERDVALGDGDAEYLKKDPWFERLRRDPRFEKLLATMRAASPS